ncbi:hypothetical protein COLO4_36526 [Corchorus olitorius]|uniref:Uncharacterized protein n=1 Tax=Corchorus olitorius TaxID=93759 RepID=A0A1R3G8B0_9ROSI|nr:hypothetical protein COLO4_36526 [Corchorus olitorius]
MFPHKHTLVKFMCFGTHDDHLQPVAPLFTGRNLVGAGPSMPEIPFIQ